jgi:hypothetical protein
MIHYYITDCGAFKVHANYPFPLCASRLIIENKIMVWWDVKGYVGRENNTFKTNDIKDLIIKGFKTLTPEKWTNF